MAKLLWPAFQHASKAFNHPGEKLEAGWSKLHAGDLEPYPSEDHVAMLLAGNPSLGTDPARIALTLQHAWRAFHSGDFEEADALATTVGPLGASVANKAMGVHAVHLIDNPDEKMRRFEIVAQRADEARVALPRLASSHYHRAFALARQAQLLSVTTALAQGIAGRVKDSLDETLKLVPAHAEAHLLLALYHAAIVGMVGPELASLTYGATAADAEKQLETAMRLTPDVPNVHLAHGDLLLLLHGDKREDQAAEAYAKAAKCRPRDAMDALDARLAGAQIE